MKSIKIFLSFFILLFLSNTEIKAQVKEKTDGNITAKISVVKKYLNWAEAFGFSGTVLIKQNNKVLLNSCYGYANQEKKLKNRLL